MGGSYFLQNVQENYSGCVDPHLHDSQQEQDKKGGVKQSCFTPVLTMKVSENSFIYRRF